jgi:hypothetical protein
MLGKRLEYLHNNPVEGGFVWSPEEYVYSSASNYYGKHEKILEDDFLTFL